MRLILGLDSDDEYSYLSQAISTSPVCAVYYQSTNTKEMQKCVQTPFFLGVIYICTSQKVRALPYNNCSGGRPDNLALAGTMTNKDSTASTGVKHYH